MMHMIKKWAHDENKFSGGVASCTFTVGNGNGSGTVLTPDASRAQSA
jgi:hypothetical protein